VTSTSTTDDGVADTADPCPAGTLLAPYYDADGCEDSVDDDGDGDGVADASDPCTN
jgi:hypothetical protein